MTKRIQAKYKSDRRFGQNLWGRPKSPVNKRQYGPGQHGQRRKGKTSDFGLQLVAKQKLRLYYGNITEKQFRKTYEEAERQQAIDDRRHRRQVGDVDLDDVGEPVAPLRLLMRSRFQKSDNRETPRSQPALPSNAEEPVPAPANHPTRAAIH